jgi:hypothetical protein
MICHDLEKIMPEKEKLELLSNLDETSEDVRYRDLDKERAEKQETEKQQETEQDFAAGQDDFAQSSGYSAERGRDVDIVESEVESDIGAEEEQELDGKKKKRRFLKTRWLFKQINLELAHFFRKSPATIFIERTQEKARKRAEAVSTYRHHSINAPGNQSGSFDDLVEAAKKHKHQSSALKKVAGVELMRAGNQMMGEMKRSAEMAAEAALAPYKQQLAQAKQAMEVAKDVAGRLESGLNMASGVTFVDMQGNAVESESIKAEDVSRAKLGNLSPNVDAKMPSHVKDLAASRGGNEHGRG